jgi:N-acyl-D-aspartate/D-glutamate deacylase
VGGREGRDGEAARARALPRRSVKDVADELGVDPLDAFLDLSLADDLEMQFVLAAPPSPTRTEAVTTMMRSPVMMAGSSDGGAHLLSFCGADYTTRLLTEWVPSVLTLEQAVARITSIPRARGRHPDRGVLAPGAPADVNVIERDALRAADAPRLVRDFPADAARYVVDAEGYVATIVNGEPLSNTASGPAPHPGSSCDNPGRDARPTDPARSGSRPATPAHLRPLGDRLRRRQPRHPLPRLFTGFSLVTILVTGAILGLIAAPFTRRAEMPRVGGARMGRARVSA